MSFFGKCGVPCFLVTPVLRLALLPYYRRIRFQYDLQYLDDNLIHSSIMMKNGQTYFKHLSIFITQDFYSTLDHFS